jgi:hypothetical protein
MQVKILSMQRVINYGSFMQAYALKRVVEGYGHAVGFCDFVPGQPRHLGAKVVPDTRLDKLRKLPRLLKSPLGYLAKRRFHRELRQTFQQVAWPLLGLSAAPDLDYDADIFIVGSDEVFNYTQNHVFGYVPAFFGHGVSARRIISYAASAGYANVGDIERDGMADEISSGLRRFTGLGVRDQNTFEIAARYGAIEPRLVIDPTLIYDFDAEVAAAAAKPIPGLGDAPYLLVYAYNGRLDSPEEIASIRQVARARGWRLVSAGFHHDWCDANLVVTPFELLRLFSRAQAVVTDTFHGSIFSIKFRRPFVSLLRVASRRGSNSNKLEYLLRQLGLESRIIGDLSQLAAQLDVPAPFDAAYTRLATLRRQSIAYLESMVAPAETATPLP